MGLNFPQDCYYDRTNHLWVQKHPDHPRVRVGIDSLGLESLGDLAYIALAPVGTRVVRGRPGGTLEAAKMTGELIAPVSGTVSARNEDVLRDPSLVNRENYGRGWLLIVEPSDWETEAAELVHGPELDEWVRAEIEHYRQQGWINV